MKLLRTAAVAALTVLVAAGCGGREPGKGPSKSGETPAPPPVEEGSLQLTSPVFEDGDPLPYQHTCDGNDRTPPLQIKGVPDDAEALALIVDDPDAPGGTFVHWVVWNLPPDTSNIRKNESPAAPTGVNDFGENSYGAPCPPEGDGPHTYRFKLYALDTELDLEAGSTAQELYDAMDGHVLDRAILKGTYARK